MRELLAYFAGIVDGEGCIQISMDSNHRSYYGMITVSMSEEVIPDLLQSVYPAYRASYKTREGKTMQTWQIVAKKAKKFVEDIYEFLRLKQNQADIIIELESSKSQKGHPGVKGLTDKDIEYREKLRLKLKELHKRY